MMLVGSYVGHLLPQPDPHGWVAVKVIRSLLICLNMVVRPSRTFDENRFNLEVSAVFTDGILLLWQTVDVG